MTDEHEKHITITDSYFEKLRPVFDVIYTKRQELANAMAHGCIRALKPAPGVTWNAGDMIAYHIAGRIPPNSVECLDFCPETMRSIPTLLRDMADMYEDLAKEISLAPAKEWEPKKTT